MANRLHTGGNSRGNLPNSVNNSYLILIFAFYLLSNTLFPSVGNKGEGNGGHGLDGVTTTMPSQRVSNNFIKCATTPWPFSMWAIEYYNKWVEAEVFVNIIATTLCRFVQKNIIARFGVPKALVADNMPIFISEEFIKLSKKFDITLHHSSPYYPQGNGQAEATNKTLIKIIKKTVEDAISQIN